MSNMHRTQIYIDEDQMGQLKLEAVRTRTTISKLIRHAIQQLLDKKQKNFDWKNDPLSKAIGKIKLTANNASGDHDSYLYGPKRGR